MPVHVYLVPPCYLPGGAITTVWPSEDGDGIDVYLSEAIPKTLRRAAVWAATSATAIHEGFGFAN